MVCDVIGRTQTSVDLGFKKKFQQQNKIIAKKR